MALIVGDDRTEFQRITDAVCTLQGPNWKKVLEHRSIKALYKPQCGALRAPSGPFTRHRKNLEYLWVVACRKLQSQVATFAELHAEIIEDNYLWLCQVKKKLMMQC